MRSCRSQGVLQLTDALPRRFRFKERPFPKLLVSLPKLFLSVHHDGAVPRDRFLERLSRSEEKPDSFLSGLHHDVVAAIEEHQRPVLRLLRRCRVSPADAFRSEEHTSEL